MRLPTPAEVDALLAGLEWPRALLFGTACSGYQVEGGFNGPGGPRNNWTAWEARPGNEPAGEATGFWRHPERDLRLAQGLHANAFRLGVEWARVQPDGPDRWNEAAVDRYAGIIASVRAHGLEPIVTLHHFTHPAWAGAAFWLEAEAPGRFAAFVKGLVDRLATRLAARGVEPVRSWITINEPNVLASASYLSDWLPPGRAAGGLGPFLRALDVIYAAHVHAHAAIHRAYAARGLPAPFVSFNNFALDEYGLDRLFVDLLLARSRGVPPAALARDLADRRVAWERALGPLSESGARRSRLRASAAALLRAFSRVALTPGRFPILREAVASSDFARPLDFVALDYYDASVANQVRLATGGYDPWEWAVHPEGLHDVLVANADGGLPILVAENGMATRRLPGGGPEPRPDGVRRDEFLRAHAYHLLRAVGAGVPILGYLHWSLTDNYEWGRFAPRFGLFGVDYGSPERQRLATDASGIDAGAAFASLARALQSGDRAALRAALLGTNLLSS